MKKFIAIIGGIAVGKTTVGQIICDNLPSTKFIQEDVSTNEFLPDFYIDMKKWAFHSRISTLAMISSNYILESDNCNYVLMDRCLDELINFAKLQYLAGNMSDREYSVYKILHTNLIYLAPSIDIFIYCYCNPNAAMQRIKMRNRPFEQNIDIDYINNLNKIYDEWIKTIDPQKIIKIDTTETFSMNKINALIEKIK